MDQWKKLCRRDGHGQNARKRSGAKKEFVQMLSVQFYTGEMTWTSGEKYIGEWENDRRNGDGLYLYSSGNRYKGHYVLGKKV